MGTALISRLVRLRTFFYDGRKEGREKGHFSPITSSSYFEKLRQGKYM